MGEGGWRQSWSFGAALVVLVAGTALAYSRLVGPGPGHARPAPVAEAAEPVRLAVSAVSGEVTFERGGARSRVEPGLELRPDDALETAPGARVGLAGGSYEVALEEGGRFDVQEITAELSRF